MENNEHDDIFTDAALRRYRAARRHRGSRSIS